MSASAAQKFRDELKKKNKSLAKSEALNPKTMIEMNRTSNGIKGIIDTLRGQLARLEAEIKADEKGKWEFDLVMGQLETRKADLQKRIKMNEEWAKQYDLKIGPFEETYDNMTASIGKTYENAKKGHARGLQVLQEEFGYHPAFKQKDDAFFAIPFKPL
ncbi:hypothetical protein TrST_g5775 [Triparma strigata]|uniref:Uncharacterized protein n=1 Tax=Triparma strigata TaxID=1606541 RepID=A0A9W7BV10_9STRA|nr:hypothetical protein TrST_g5775 [Triparma strigata]|mmetsp:Transcript_18032/g.33511  ORF Transcript_18032/g.33511 Transcript_18032/m.33511 type:complete len:159 (+) Transcript_18032:145-621(+)|eukprot:CAMPEP_0182509884 /NCGR_PEP_ID=MMETSP1321-20130603/27628_1 /TAXON_ID=91990 /ORGANISM="Bolidomonas sp., Strain RCC1657" /LENGTH=158 /DNA_ID=CAMNT_0024716257 /DNA_START=123 /DNA_END=599 /DNA_ORIENTATION=-